MASTITITCPECKKQIKAPADLVGKKIRCKGCGHAFVAKADEEDEKPAKPARPAGKAPAKPEPAKPAKPSDDEDDEDANPYGVTSLDLAPRCPNCANEMESAEAIICLYCGYNTVTREQAKTRKIAEVTGGDQFLWLLPGILCVIADLLLIGGVVWVIIGAIIYNPDGEFAKYQRQAAGCCALWWTILSIWVGYKATRFAVKRLILHPTPPEREELG
jgi:DNA-directed RNA polymerase subunit RPC12/RpoP